MFYTAIRASLLQMIAAMLDIREWDD
jgi:hypothetical protein